MNEGHPIEIRTLGTVSYREGIKRQEELVGRRRAGEIPDQLLLLEHPHVITLGSGADRGNILADASRMDALGLEVSESGRGGDVTYHGPGQVVGYPILDLKPDRKDLHRYLRDLEEVLIRTLAAFDITGRRVSGQTGVWTDGGKVAAIGVRVSSGWITSHGFALNVSTDLSYFGTIVPCGIRDQDVTSIEAILGAAPPAIQLTEELAAAFEEVFDRRVRHLEGWP